MIKYSFIIPNYNGEKYIDECLRNIVKEKRNDIEIIVIDDGSTDDSVDIIKKNIEIDKRIKLITKKNSGVSVARNTGIDIATGKYMIFVDSDDYIYENMLSKFDEIINNYPEIDFISCGFNSNSSTQEYDLCEKSVRKEFYSLTLNIKNENKYGYINNFPCVWGKAFKTEIINKENIRFNSNLVMGEDMIFVLEFLSKINRIVVFPKSVYFYRENMSSATRKINYKIPERDYIFQYTLRELCQNEGFECIDESILEHMVLNGILTCCDTCFFKYRFRNYKKMKKDLIKFLTNELYVDSLKTYKYNHEFNFVQNIILFLLKNKIYYLAYILKKVTYQIKK